MISPSCLICFDTYTNAHTFIGNNKRITRNLYSFPVVVLWECGSIGSIWGFNVPHFILSAVWDLYRSGPGLVSPCLGHDLVSGLGGLDYNRRNFPLHYTNVFSRTAEKTSLKQLHHSYKLCLTVLPQGRIYQFQISQSEL